MKKLFLSTVLLLSSYFSFCQRAPLTKPYTQEELLKISKSQKAAGLVFLGIGVISFASIHNAPFRTFRTKLTIASVSGLISIPLFIGSGINAKRARKVAISLKLEQNQFEQISRSDFHSIPALSLKLNL